MYQLGPQIDVNALVDRIAGASAVVMLAGALLIFVIGRLVAVSRAPKQAQSMSTMLAETFKPLTNMLALSIEQGNQRETDSAKERSKFIAVLDRLADWQDGSVKRHEEYMSPILLTMRGIAESISSSNQTLVASNDALLAEIKALRSALASEAEKNREHVTSTLSTQLTPVGKGIGSMSEQLNDLNAKMDARNEANGAAFKDLQKGLTDLKTEVIQLAAATSQEHTKIRADLLAKIDELVRQVAALANPSQAKDGDT